jgi:hypothetical protein
MTQWQPDALDFWLGSWTCTWPGGTGTNTVSRVLGGAAIEEVFESHGDDGDLFGRSYSVLDPADGQWKQTWVDSSGAYLDFVGVRDGSGRISFQRSAGTALQRMVWLDVTPDGFRWEWQRSTDGGTTWAVMWPLDYRRVR